MFVAGVATLALLALPSLAFANPGSGPELVQRSGRLVVVHADRADGGATRQWTLVQGASHVPVRAPADVWVAPGTPVRLEGTMQDGTLVVADSLTAVEETGVAPMLASAKTANATAGVHNAAVILAQWSTPLTIAGPGNVSQNADAVMNGAGGLPDNKSLSAFYLEQTYGQVDFQGFVFGRRDAPGIGPGVRGEHRCVALRLAQRGEVKARRRLRRVDVPAHRPGFPDGDHLRDERRAGRR